MKPRVVDGLLAALATIVSAWPITTLLAQQTWFAPGLLLVIVAMLSGMALRGLRVHSALVLLVQLALVVLVTGWLFTAAQLWYGLPGPASVEHAVALVQEAIRSMNRYAAPAPATPGLVFLTASLFGVVAAVVDFLAVTRRTPAVAGLPLLIAFLVSASNSGASLNPVFFLAIAAMWLVLLARQGTAHVRRWGTGAATPATPVANVADNTGVSAYASLARSLGVVVLVAAVALPAVLPHLPPTYLASGLGRNPAAKGHGPGTVGFNETLDLRADLTNRDHTPVIRYRTKDPAPPPLRVSVTSTYDASSGRWLPRAADDRGTDSAAPTDHAAPEPLGLSSRVPRQRWSMTVVTNGLRAPQVATPFPLVRGEFDEGWWVTSDTQVTRAVKQPDRYAVTYLELSPSGNLPRDIRDNQGLTQLPQDVDASDLKLPSRSAATVRDLAARVTHGRTTVLAKAIAIQDYLRDPGRFTYSLTLAPPVRGKDGQLLDPITHFLRTKRGYCVQFATAMIMMARAEGIPARMAVGFLPGTFNTNRNEWIVTAADAHAWPELYLEGLGWTRFEPTPSVRSGLPPLYAVNLGGTSGGGGDQSTLPRQGGGHPVPLPQRRPDIPGSVAAAAPSAQSPLPWPWIGAGGALVLLLAGASTVPLAARRRRGVAARHAAGPRQRVEAQWEGFLTRLDDLGIARPVGRTPRQLHGHYVRQFRLEPPAAEALGRALTVLEECRYAPPDADVAHDLRPELRVVSHAISEQLNRRTRWAAEIWPRSGRHALREEARGTGQRIRAAATSLTERFGGGSVRGRKASGSASS
ncbi:MAG TPA: DUF3488 and transglutaminase-like domain-containing protein [Segeticoccus sp.]|uniref:transglutaminase family protein n=1 Tax=Segeticoccus sp. TaxID=2706531 RepID=UPI002D7F06B4|nr:DUF3488 and transglutaminase-like domain-containing protein [Segeticoccus sp.]HET8601892.1 DUF3488 and transglutaminase-like domain-containing protein [Segeticoccus sp.]